MFQMTPKIFASCSLLAAASFILWYNVEKITYPSYGTTFDYSFSIFETKNLQSDSQSRTNRTKWIVVTSIQFPTEDVKNLASQSGWAVVVVADKKTPINWSFPNVHFLSVDKQDSFGSFAKLLPFNSYARKTLGYLYAIKNGAQWIYDTDDDNKPYGLGLAQFDYGETVSGLRYISKSQAIGEKLFNPYQFYGFKEMWPRGFPLEYLKEHTNGKDRMLLCRNMKTAAVQQGVVHNDPDVDAIYRLENADKLSGLHVTFNRMAPAITLEEGTYSPWNSQNTLFHYRAFFTMFLPTTVAFRVTDIWRSYFAQKLLHLIGEEVAFYPVNAVQFRNAHDYLKDFEQEIDVYEKSGQIVRFLDEWYCNSGTIEGCAVSLAQDFAKNKFWEQKDYELVKSWIKALKDVGYVFPQLKFTDIQTEYKVTPADEYSNCREANLNLGTGEYSKVGKKDLSRAENTLSAYSELQNWCIEAEENGAYEQLPTPEEFSKTFENGVWKDRKENVLVIINNFPWTNSIGLLQRMYSSFFGTLIFCGTWDPANLVNETLQMIEPVNFINITKGEMHDGHFYSYCFSKVRDLRLQNVKGYFFIGDDTIMNFWQNTSLEIVVNSASLTRVRAKWQDWMPVNLNNLLSGKYKDDQNVKHLLNQVQTKLRLRGTTNMTSREYLTNFTGRTQSDWIYIPSHELDYMSDLIELLTEARYFVENSMLKVLETLNYTEGPMNYDWNYNSERGYRFSAYNPNNLGYHPLKMKRLDQDLKQRASFCKYVIRGFVKNIFKRKAKTIPTTAPSVAEAELLKLLPPAKPTRKEAVATTMATTTISRNSTLT